MLILHHQAYPETKGLSMERMEELFEMPWYRVGRTSVKFIANETREEIREDEKARNQTQAEHVEL
jgi:MFS transporter, SP family, sugar:H+ symporter